MAQIRSLWGWTNPEVESHAELPTTQAPLKKSKGGCCGKLFTYNEAELIEGLTKEAGIKHDAGKLPMDLIPPEAERMEAEVLLHGLKYGSHNWRGGLNYSRLIASLMRHFNAWRSGEDLDQESGLSHMAHVRAISGFLCTFIAEDRHELDNRYRRVIK